MVRSEPSPEPCPDCDGNPCEGGDGTGCETCDGDGWVER